MEGAAEVVAAEEEEEVEEAEEAERGSFNHRGWNRSLSRGYDRSLFKAATANYEGT